MPLCFLAARGAQGSEGAQRGGGGGGSRPGLGVRSGSLGCSSCGLRRCSFSLRCHPDSQRETPGGKGNGKRRKKRACTSVSSELASAAVGGPRRRPRLPPSRVVGARSQRRTHLSVSYLKILCLSFMCVCKLSLREKRLAHTAHLKGFSPVCAYMCRLHLDLSRNSLAQNGHV